MPPVTKLLAVCVLALGLYGCGVNNIPTFEEQAKADWAQVQNQYKRRADLIPNLVETVKFHSFQAEQVSIKGIFPPKTKPRRPVQIFSETTDNCHRTPSTLAMASNCTSATERIV